MLRGERSNYAQSCPSLLHTLEALRLSLPLILHIILLSEPRASSLYPTPRSVSSLLVVDQRE